MAFIINNFAPSTQIENTNGATINITNGIIEGTEQNTPTANVTDIEDADFEDITNDRLGSSSPIESGIICDMTEDQLELFFADKTKQADGFYQDAEGEWRYELHPAHNPYISRGEDWYIPGCEGTYDIYMWDLNK